jgi:CheY-like chemotaxis protein
MPEMDGWAFSRIVQRYGIPVLFTSAIPGEGEAILRGCTGLLRKPLTPTKLRDEVGRILGQTREPPSVLVVDDDPEVRLAMASILTPGFRTLEAEHGQAALALLETEPVALVITDVMMPVMDGRELVRRLRAEPRFARLPVIVQTSDRQIARARIWTQLQVEQVMTKMEFLDWLLARIDLTLAGDDADAAWPD